MPTQSIQRWILFAAVAIAAATPVPGASAAEMAAGTVINRATIDAAKASTFEGQKLGDVIPERAEWQIRNHNLTMTLEKYEPHPTDTLMAAATEKYAKGVKLNSATRQISGYVAGVPFPNIDTNDPDAGTKVVWNYYFGAPRGDRLFADPFAYTLVDGTKGIERVQEWGYKRFYKVGRLTGDVPTLGDGSIFHNTLLHAHAPQDVKGLGVYSVRYTSGQVDDVWAYVRSVRRVRRLSGGAWMDPIGGTDQLNDDLEIFNAHPTWYPGYKMLGKVQQLVVARTGPKNHKCWNLEGKTDAEKWWCMDTSQAPYWNPKLSYERRDVFIVECTPPPEHPYSKKIVWFDAKIWAPYYAVTYDRKGDFWKWMNFFRQDFDDEINPGRVITFTSGGLIADYQRMHATFFHVGPMLLNVESVKEEDISLSALEAAGR